MEGPTPELLAELFRALSHPFRLRLLQELRRGEECVCHFAALFDKPQPYVSQQIAELREAGLVVDRRDGQRVFYRLRDERVAELLAGAAAVGGWPRAPSGPRPRPAGCTCPRCN